MYIKWFLSSYYFINGFDKWFYKDILKTKKNKAWKRQKRLQISFDENAITDFRINKCML